MIDTDKYEGHTPAPWNAEEEEVEEGKAWTVRGGDHWVVMESDGCLRIDWKKEDALLAADAPLLLAEVKRLRMIVARLEDARIENAGIHERPKLFAAVLEIYEQRLHDIYQERREEE